MFLASRWPSLPWQQEAENAIFDTKSVHPVSSPIQRDGAFTSQSKHPKRLHIGNARICEETVWRKKKGFGIQEGLKSKSFGRESYSGVLSMYSGSGVTAYVGIGSKSPWLVSLTGCGERELMEVARALAGNRKRARQRDWWLRSAKMRETLASSRWRDAPLGYIAHIENSTILPLSCRVLPWEKTSARNTKIYIPRIYFSCTLSGVLHAGSER